MQITTMVLKATTNINFLDCTMKQSVMIWTFGNSTLGWWVLIGYFYDKPILPQPGKDDHQIQMETITTFLFIYKARMNILLILKAKIFFPLNPSLPHTFSQKGPTMEPCHVSSPPLGMEFLNSSSIDRCKYRLEFMMWRPDEDMKCVSYIHTYICFYIYCGSSCILPSKLRENKIFTTMIIPTSVCGTNSWNTNYYAKSQN